jgi:hypothetical protein
MSVQQFVANPAVQRFDLGVLRWLSGLDEVQIDFLFRSSLQHSPARKLWTSDTITCGLLTRG